MGRGHPAQGMGEQPVTQGGGDQDARGKPAPDAVADVGGPLLGQQGEQGAKQAGHRQLDAGEPGGGNGLGEVAMDRELDAEGGGGCQKPEQRQRDAPLGAAGEQQQAGDGERQGEPVVATRSGLEGSPGGERRHQGGHAHDEGAAAQRIALADGGDPEQQAGAEQGAAARSADQVAAVGGRLAQPGKRQQQEGGQQETAADKGGGREFADRLFREEPAGGGQQGDQHHQQQGSAVHRGHRDETGGESIKERRRVLLPGAFHLCLASLARCPASNQFMP